ncbi:unnamed protein product [Periconia digitata]|uniref:Rrn9 domain-containing protein n=1 Tax=Periconia digitata TaxID=1303443 RepID=A0A9W4UHR4_9PLEO|nr:unnamed protein product [Periconia digitata]
MSLFGGDGAIPSLSTSPSPPPSSLLTAPINETEDVQDAQRHALHPATLDTDADDSEPETDSYDDEEDPETSRPNKFTGHARTWRGYTFADRQIAASLGNIEASDLGAHLYNTHHLKHRMRRPPEQLVKVQDWHKKESWLKKGKELEFTNPFGEIEEELIPKKSWSAWPLPPSRIQKADRGVRRPDDDEDTWCIEAARADDVGEAMREEIMALFVRRAKDQWLSRESEDEDEEDGNATDAEADLAESNREDTKPAKPESVTTSDVEMRDHENSTGGSGLKEDTVERSIERRGAYRGFEHDGSFTKPVFLADDDTAQQILQPSVNSLLTSLDDLALSIRRVRLNHTGRGAYSEMSGSEFTSDAESSAKSIGPSTRSSRQPTKGRGKASGSRRRSRTHSKKAVALPAPKPLDESDSASDYRRDQAEDSESASSSSDQSLPRQKRGSVGDSRRNSDASNTPGFEKDQTGLMDWSEVLGIASITGWNEIAVARTAQRCAELFKESMSYRRLSEASVSKPIPDVVQYTPSTVPDYEALGIGTSPPPKRPFFNAGTLRCPHTNCWGSEQDFKIPYRTIEHVIRIHRYDPRKNNSDNEERKYGGVHIDGFLQPVTAKQGWLGSGRARSKSTDQNAETIERTANTRKKQKTDAGASPQVEASV